MKYHHSKRREDGVALLTVLVILSIIAFIVLSLFVIDSQETRITNYDLKSSEARLAAESGFRDASNLLTHLAREGSFVTTVANLPNKLGEKGDGKPARYTFLSRLEKGKVTHYPLFTGGTKLEKQVNNISVMSCGTPNSVDLLAGSPIRPEVRFSSDAGNYLTTYGLSTISADGRVEAETTSPLVGQVTMAGQSGDRFSQRYSFWMEDLEGYPNLDLVDGHLNDRGDFEYVLSGNSPNDQRANKNLFQPLAVNPDLAYVFRRDDFAGQKRNGLAAPGLSAQELLLVPGTPAADHPYRSVHQVLSGRRQSLYAGGHLSQSPGMENRLAQGLFPYFISPTIPFNHGYQDEGKPKYQVNQLLQRIQAGADKRKEIQGVRDFLSRNLVAFSQRRGGFPEDYLATMIANMIDYADEDSKPTIRKDDARSLQILALPNNSIGGYTVQTIKADRSIFDQSKDYRGVDSYLPVNEFFYRIEVDGITRTSPTSLRAAFSVTPFVEFWNPFPAPVTMENVTANFWFVEPFKFKAGVHEYPLNSPNPSWKLPGYEKGDYPVTNEPRDRPQKFTVPANSYYVHNFGRIVWNFEVEVPPSATNVKIDSIGAPFKSGDKDGKAQLQLLVDGAVVDQSGRPYFVNSQNQELTAYNIPRFRDTNNATYTALKQPGKGLAAGDFMMVYFRPCNERQASFGYGTFFGDPFMSYYGAGHAQDIDYKKASPGSRNHYETSAQDDSLKSGTRVRDWPDRGYDEATGPKPRNIHELPTSNQFRTSSRVSTATFRISNRGRYFSMTELGHLHDPAMWMIKHPGSDSRQSYATISSIDNPKGKQKYREFGGVDDHGKYNALWFYPKSGDFEAVGDDNKPGNERGDNYCKIFGGGNTLRIGRKEHPLFDQEGMRASQWLDLLQAGVTGSNLEFVNDPAYASFDSSVHYPPLAARSEKEAGTEPYSRVYPPYAHAGSELQRIHGHLNINTAPSAIEMETLLRSPFLMNELVALPEDNTGNRRNNGPLALRDGADPKYSIARNGLDESKIPLIAAGLIKARPFASSSHLARVLSELIYQHDALPLFPNDQIMEEPVARVINLTNLTSRHFRIFVQGEVVPKPPANSGITEADIAPVSRSMWVHEVFLQEERDASGKVTGLSCKTLSSREL